MLSTTGIELRALRPDDAAAARELFATAAPAEAMRAASWEADLADGSALGCGAFAPDGTFLSCGVALTLGRTAFVQGIAVIGERRGSGIGSHVLEGLAGALARRDVTIIGAELDFSDLRTFSFLGRFGFKPAPATFAMEAAVVRQGGDGGAPPALPAGLELVRGPEAAPERLAEVAAIATGLDADFDPTRFVNHVVASGRADLLLAWPGDDVASGSPCGFALLPHPGAGEPTDRLAASMLVLDEGSPFPVMHRLAGGLAVVAALRGASRVVVPAPGRYWDALRELFVLGFRPVASSHRLTLHGYPERSEPRRALLCSWR